MAALTHSSSKWSGSVTQTSSSATYKFETAGKYIDQNIELTVNANAVTELSGTNITLSASDVNPSGIYITAGNITRYVKDVTLTSGKKLTIKNNVNNSMTIEYNSSTNSIDFVFV